MTGAAEAGRLHRRQGDILVLLRLIREIRPVRLDGAAEVDAAAVDDREARLLVGAQPVVANVRRAPRDLALTLAAGEGGDHERPFGEVSDRPEIDGVRLDSLPGERGENGKAERRQDDAGADDPAETDRGERDEARAAVGLEVLSLGSELRLRRRAVDERVCRGRVDGGMRPGRVANPEHTEDDGDRGAENCGRPADHEPDEDAGDPDREADRPEAVAGCG